MSATMRAIVIEGGKGPATAMRHRYGSAAGAARGADTRARARSGCKSPGHRAAHGSVSAACGRARDSRARGRGRGRGARRRRGALEGGRPGHRAAARRRLCGICGRRRAACAARTRGTRSAPGSLPARDRIHRLEQRVRARHTADRRDTARPRRQQRHRRHRNPDGQGGGSARDRHGARRGQDSAGAQAGRGPGCRYEHGRLGRHGARGWWRRRRARHGRHGLLRRQRRAAQARRPPGRDRDDERATVSRSTCAC